MNRVSLLIMAAMALVFVACGSDKTEPAGDKPAVVEEKAEPAPQVTEKKVEEAKPEVKTEEAKPEEKTDEAKAGEAQAGDAPKVDDVVELAVEGATKPAVKFPHKMHVDLEVMGGKCDQCHHTAKDDVSKIKGCMADGCHNGKTEGVPDAKKAFHKTCQECHKKILADKPDNEKLKKVKTCNGCHAAS